MFLIFCKRSSHGPFQAAPGLEVARQNLAVALTDLGTQRKALGDLQTAGALYERALAIHPAYPEALYNLGVLYSECRSWHRAMVCYHMALAIAPHCAEARERTVRERAAARPALARPLFGLARPCSRAEWLRRR